MVEPVGFPEILLATAKSRGRTNRNFPVPPPQKFKGSGSYKMEVWVTPLGK